MTYSRCLWVLSLLLPGGLLLAASAQAGNGQRWVPYSAHYTETVSSPDSSASPANRQTFTEEFRSNDGSTIKVVKVDGKSISGRLWLASGQQFSLDYPAKRAVFEGQSPRRHPYVPPDAPLGTMTLAGLTCTVYPIHMASGHGTVCVDMEDDILGRIEVHMDSDGVRQDYVTELTWIDLISPVDSSWLKVPPGFTTLVPSAAKHSQHYK
jgi:hypothetical protein